ncbi:hypothetical protein ACOME3_004431 [Neoechinorhynchus agilis]
MPTYSLIVAILSRIRPSNVICPHLHYTLTTIINRGSSLDCSNWRRLKMEVHYRGKPLTTTIFDMMAATNGRKHNPAVFERTLPVFIPFLTLSSVAVISLYNSGVSKIIHDYWHRRQPPEKTAHIFPEFHPGKSLPKIPKTEWCEYEEIRRNANQALHKDDVRSCEKEVKAGNSSNEPYIFVSDDLMSETEISLH